MDRLTDLTLILPDRVGSLAQTIGTLSRAGLEIQGCAGFPAWAGEGILHVLVGDVDVARSLLRESGIDIREERDLLITTPLAGTADATRVLEQIAAVGVNVDLIYQMPDGRLAVGVNDLPKATRAVGDLAADYTAGQ